MSEFYFPSYVQGFRLYVHVQIHLYGLQERPGEVEFCEPRLDNLFKPLVCLVIEPPCCKLLPTL